MCNLWRLQTRTKSSIGEKIGQYCIDNSCLAMGWSIKDEDIEDKADDEIEKIRDLRGKIETFEDYEKLIKDYKIYEGKVNDNVRRLYSSIKTNDLVWMRQDGLYYLGIISSESNWQYQGDKNSLNLDTSNQINNVKWFFAADESDVPGAICTAFISRKTLQHIWNEGAKEYSQLICNEKVGRNFSENNKRKCDASTFYSFLSTDDCEDLLCLWLYNEYGYIAIPSTNKKSTELYECVLLDPKTGKHIYPQVKTGKVNINAEKYLELAKTGEVWLFTTNGKIDNFDKSNDKIHVADPEELFAFAGKHSAKNILPHSIMKWYEILQK